MAGIFINRLRNYAKAERPHVGDLCGRYPRFWSRFHQRQPFFRSSDSQPSDGDAGFSLLPAKPEIIAGDPGTGCLPLATARNVPEDKFIVLDGGRLGHDFPPLSNRLEASR